MQSKLIENIDSFVYTDGIDEFNDNNQEPIYESGYASRYGSVTSSIKKPLDNYVVNQYPTASSQLGKAIIANGNDLVDHGIPSEMFHTVTEEMLIPHESECESEFEIRENVQEDFKEYPNTKEDFAKPELSEAQKLINLDNFNKLADRRK